MAYLVQIKKTWLPSFLMALVLALSACSGKNKGGSETGVNNGEEVFMKYCLSCHQMSGSGVPGMYPTLHQTDWVAGDKTRLIMLLLKGQQGQITVNGTPFQGVMPPHDYLTDEQIAAVLTYVRSNFGNQADAVTAREVAEQRAQSVAR